MSSLSELEGLEPAAQGRAAGGVVLFDGVCNLCNGAVQFIIDRDPGARLRFAALQSEIGQRLMEHAGYTGVRLDSIVFIENGTPFDRSTAVLRIVRHLQRPWPLLALALMIPRPVRDFAYGIVARHRYRWFGREPHCRVPTPSLRARFLDYQLADAVDATRHV